jgi:large subunit ribosomal protein L34
VRTVDVV